MPFYGDLYVGVTNSPYLLIVRRNKLIIILIVRALQLKESDWSTTNCEKIRGTEFECVVALIADKR